MLTRLILALACLAMHARAAELERVVIVERHGVRAPSKPPEVLSKYATYPFPAWPVPPGELTPHGAEALARMGAWFRAAYAARGLLPQTGCPQSGEVFVWADGQDRRTIESGDAILRGLAPGCGLAASHAAAGRPDPVFDAMVTGDCPLDAKAAGRAVLHAMPGGLEAPVPGYAAALETLRSLLDPPASRAPCRDSRDRCFEEGFNSLAVDPAGARIKGPLATASMLAEAMALQDDEGLALPKAGPGGVSETALRQVLTLHSAYNRLTRREPVIAGSRGARLAQAVLASLEGRTPFAGERDAAKLTLVLGHDTTLATLAGLFGLDWSLPGQPDDTPPGGAIVLEVLHGPVAGEHEVRAFLVYQTSDQLRTLARLDTRAPPEQVSLSPQCAGGPGHGCSLAALHAQANTIVPGRCLPP